MASKLATAVAQVIIDDLQGAAYHRDPKILLKFLESKFEQVGERKKAENVAKAIIDDLDGAGYYRDPEILAAFLEGQGLR